MLFSIITVYSTWQSASDTHLLFLKNVLLMDGTTVTPDTTIATEVIVYTPIPDIPNELKEIVKTVLM